METSRRSVPLRRAIEHLETRIRGARRHEMLPSVASLARECGVAYVTMWKALDHLRDQGAIRARPRRGIEVLNPIRPPGSAVSPAPPRSELGTKWQRVTTALRRDLVRGFFAPGTALPSVKELTEQYGVCAATLSKALHELVEDGTLLRQRTRYVPRPALPGRPASVVLLAARGTADATVEITHPRIPEYLRALEHTCSLKKVRLTIVPYDVAHGRLHDSDFVDALRARGRRCDTVLGTLVWQAGIDSRPWTDLMRLFVPLSKPIAMFDESGESSLPRVAGAGRRIRHYALGYSAQAGLQMGRYLIGLGHRRVAFLSALHRTAWSGNRLAGLKQAYAEIGEPRAVREFVRDEFALPSELAKLLRPHAHRIGALLSSPLNIPEDQRAVHDKLVVGLGRRLEQEVTARAYMTALRSLMETAIEDEPITAWVAADDDNALPCLEYLRECGIDVPGRISVVGFDDSLESSLHKLTSYNYNGAAYMRAMLAHVLSPGCPESGGGGTGTVEIDGTIVARRTSGPAPGV
ncbi:MAG: GntR family transcriptional regulator [Chitinivibrionales bacterium]|nr:GntR family transcriptional regulator [Chitinivibrionales bacterium]